MANGDMENEDRSLADLLQRAGRRIEPPADLTQRVYERSLAEWQALYQSRRNRRMWLRAAAIGGLAVGAALMFATRFNSAIGNIDRLHGSATIERDGAASAAEPAMKLRKLDRLTIAAGSVAAVRLTGGSRLLVAGGSTLQWQGADSVTLTHGRVFHDTDASNAAAPLTIMTSMGSLRHVGTRYQAAVNGFELTVLVRTGKVRYDGHGLQRIVERGERLSVDAAGHVNLDAADNLGADWDWIDPFDEKLTVEGRSLHEVLDHIARRAGLDLVFAQPSAEKRARVVILHGPEIGLPPISAARAVLASTTLQLRVERMRMIVSE